MSADYETNLVKYLIRATEQWAFDLIWLSNVG